jgi:NTP pyrophosphatase (non-canonical NTP hydrolase)
VTLDEICDNVRLLAGRHGWDETDSVARMVHVTAEMGEVAEALISLWTASSDQTEAARTALGHEIFDTIWNLCALANATGINIAEAGQAKMALNAERSWADDRI